MHSTIVNIKNRLIAILLLTCFYTNAQDRYGENWLVGLSPSHTSFKTGNFVNSAFSLNGLLYITNACISDSVGNFLFYTNGARVFNRNAEMMMNGDSLTFNDIWPNVQENGMASEQGAIILPHPGNPFRYVIIHHSSLDTQILVKGTYIFVANKLLYSEVDMQGDSGKGDVTIKNKTILAALLDGTRMTACRHANGRDWWIVKNAFIENAYYKFLLTPSGLEGPYKQNIGPEFKDSTANHISFFGRAVFSEDGSRYATISGRGPIVVMDFDRCTGMFSNPISYPYLFPGFPTSGGISVAFSPGGRYLYANHINTVDQFDLDNISAVPLRLITFPDTFFGPVDSGLWRIRTSQLAPDGKIYFSTYNGGTRGLHVIHAPDSGGFACRFVPLGQPVETDNATSLPNMPNYKLGRLAGSSCDTLLSGIGEPTLNTTLLKIYPNPATDVIQMELSLFDSNNTIVISDVMGKQLYRGSMQASKSIDISQWAEGLYFVQIQCHTTNNIGQIANGKFQVTR